MDAVICGFLADNNPLMPPYFYSAKNWCHQTLLVTGEQMVPLMDESSKKDDGDKVYCSDEGARSECFLKRNMRTAWGKQSEWEKRARLDGCIAVAVLTLLLGFFCLAAFLLFPWPIIDHNFADVPSDESGFRFVEVAKICGNDGHCRTVKDIITRKSNSARRAMFFDGLTDSFESEVQLIRPKNATVDDSDTRLWRVDHGILLNEYVAAMALMPFLVGALTATSSSRRSSNGDRMAHVAVIGLGGGSLDAFLHLKFPWVNITVYEKDILVVQLARQWFQISDDQTRRTVIRDGADAISDHATKGDRFDAIILDACDSFPHLSCPAAPFIALDMLAKAKSALRPQGVFVLNALPASERIEHRTLSLLQQKLLSVFPLCVRMRMGRQLNSVYACVPYVISSNDRENTARLWQQNKDTIAEQLQLRSLLSGSRLSIGPTQ